MLTRISCLAALTVFITVLPHAAQVPSQHRIIYVQAVKYQASVTPAHAAETLRSARETFRRMPQVRSVRIGRVTRTNSGAYEYALIMEFDSMDDLKAYAESAVHRQWVREHSDVPIEQHLMLTVDTAEFEN